MMDVSSLVQILVILLLVATGVGLLSRWLRFPYVTGLVLAGLPITEVFSRRIGLEPSLVLNLFLPILIFEAAINTDISRLRNTFKPIALLAGPGAIFSSIIIACRSCEIRARTSLDTRTADWRNSGKHRYGFNDCCF
jgi:monovalent cation:H+ antiporter, CPA1 family